MTDASSARRWRRYRVELQIKVFVIEDGAQKIVYGQGTDVSEGGMSAHIPLELNEGSHLELELMFPHSQDQIRVAAIVRNRNGSRYGLEYARVSPTDREMLGRSIRALANIIQ
jgi:c-di-GMP-binding flagellar brake protein YcgR